MIAKENLQARQAKQGETGFGMGHTTSTKTVCLFPSRIKRQRQFLLWDCQLYRM